MLAQYRGIERPILPDGVGWHPLREQVGDASLSQGLDARVRELDVQTEAQFTSLYFAKNPKEVTDD